MRKIKVLNFVSLDGYFSGPHGEIDWFKSIDKDYEYDKETREQSTSGSVLLFGRNTYEMMRSYWPTIDARKTDPVIAAAVNNGEKIVVSRTLHGAEEGPHWKNVKIIPEMTKKNIELIKKQKGKDITILGSGSVVQQLANWGLIDEYQLMVVPIIIGSGKNMFKDVRKMDMRMIDIRSYKNGIVRLRFVAV